MRRPLSFVTTSHTSRPSCDRMRLCCCANAVSRILFRFLISASLFSIDQLYSLELALVEISVWDFQLSISVMLSSLDYIGVSE